MRVHPALLLAAWLAGGSALLTSSCAAPPPPPPKPVLYRSFMFRVYGVRGQPGHIRKECPLVMRAILSKVDGVEATVVFARHPSDPTDTTVTVRYDPEKTGPRALGNILGQGWDMAWLECRRCGGTSPRPSPCCGDPMVPVR